MEMTVTSFHQEMEEPENETIESVVLPFFSQTDKIFEQPQVIPHVGEQYQAVIPSLIIECKSKSLEAGMNLPKFVSELTGLNSQISHRTEILELRVEHMDFQSQPMKCVGSGAKDIDLCLSEESRAKFDEVDKDLCLFHYSLSESWREMDCQSFVLGLYIFGKNFTLLQRFVRTKTMGDILSYYYGTFYSSNVYRRWSRGRKSSNRWCIKGQKIFTGWRQQELICRLSSRVSIEIQNRLLQLSQNYEEGKMSFEDYVFTLTNLVDMDILVEAIGIGKGKRDLTRKSMESKKANRVISVHPELLLTSKACSLLTSSDIIKILTGDFRLSKTRCHDLFWEAVWPRLLARGWHSEQRNKHVLFGYREPLIFFLPGVGKFSKCELLKGSHYFDSVSDVLHKVASEPELLDSEINEQNGNSVDPCVHPKIDDDMPLEKFKCYLQPRCRSGDLDQLKFPVVDTSMADGARFKFRGLRCLPAQTIRISHFSSDSGEMEGDATKKSVQGQDGSTSKPLENMTGNKVSLDNSDCPSTVLNATMLPTVVHLENQKAQSKRQLKERKAEKYQFGRKIDTGSLKNLAYLTNKWDQNGNFPREQQTSDAEHVSSNETNFLSLFSDVIPEPGFRKNSKSSTSLTSSAIGGVENDVNISESFQGKDVLPENRQSMALIDLNLPHVDTDSATDELLKMQSALCENNLLFSPESKHSCISSSKLSNGVLGTENNQRPTRNRPLTTKALEAFEHEFFNEKGKRKNGTQHNNVKTKPFRQARAKNGKKETVKNGSGGQTRMVDFKVEENSIWPPVTPILTHTFCSDS